MKRQQLPREVLVLSCTLLALSAAIGIQRRPALVSGCTAYLAAGQPIPVWVAPSTVLCLHAGDYPHSTLRITTNSATYQAAPGERPHLVGPDIEVFGHDVALVGLAIDAQGSGQPALVLRGDHDSLVASEVYNGTYNGVELRGTNATLFGDYLHGFDTHVPGSDAHCVDVLPTAANVSIVGNTISSCSGDGVQAYYPNTALTAPDGAGGEIRDNVFSYGTVGYGENAIDLKRGIGWLITGNTASGYGRAPIPGSTEGNPALFIHKFASNVLVSGNVISDSAKGIEVFGGSGLDTGAQPVSVTVSSNTFIAVGPGYLINVVGVPASAVTIGANPSFPNGLPTATATATPTPSVTPSPTYTPSPSATPTSTATPTPRQDVCNRLSYWDGYTVIVCPQGATP